MRIAEIISAGCLKRPKPPTPSIPREHPNTIMRRRRKPKPRPFNEPKPLNQS